MANPAKRARLDHSEERKTLVSALNKLTNALENTVNECTRHFESAQDVEEYIKLDNKTGIRLAYAPMPAYAECMSSVSVKNRKELEQVFSRHYQDEDVNDCVEDLLANEERYNKLMVRIDKELVKVEDRCAYSDVVSVGKTLPSDLSLVEASSGVMTKLESYWKQSKYTLFILVRHFG